MISLNKLETLVYRFSTFASKTNLVFVKPSGCSHQSHLLYRPICSENQPNPTVSYLINSCGLSPEGAISASKHLKLRSPKRADSVLAVLRNHGFSQTQISKLVRSSPSVIQADPEKTILPKLEYLTSCGISSNDISTILASNSKLIKLSLDKSIIPIYNFIRNCVLSDKDVVAVLKHGSWIVSKAHSKITDNVVPNIRTLTQLGMPQSSIFRLLTSVRCITLNPEKFAPIGGEVKEMGFDVKSSHFLLAISALCYKNTFDRSRVAYMKWGWSDDDVRSAFMKDPQCMQVSEKKIIKVMDFVVNKMGWPAGMISRDPKVMCYSFDKRIMPRCSVVKVLLLEGLIKKHFSILSVLTASEKQFLEKFVMKFEQQVPQLMNVYQGKVCIQDA